MNEPVKVLFASCARATIPKAVEHALAILPELPLYVVSEFEPPQGVWIPYHVKRDFRENLALCRAKLADKDVRISAAVLEPKAPYRAMRWLAFIIAPTRFLAFNENFGHFMLRPRSLPSIAGHLLWRFREFAWKQTHPGGWLYTWVWRFAHPGELRRPIFYRLALLTGVGIALIKKLTTARTAAGAQDTQPAGMSVVIPSRNGKDLLNRLLPTLEGADEILIVDNGSTDGTADAFPGCRVIHVPEPLSFASAANRGIAAAKFSHVCLLNNDMTCRPGFLAILRQAFDAVPELFCATAQIFFPEEKRREETGKAVMPPRLGPADFPLRCDMPLEGEDHTWVLYGSGGCSMYDAAKLHLLGGFDQRYDPAYCEDLDLGYRAWQRGWSSVFVAGAQVIHEHRSTTSRYYSADQLRFYVERNYLRFLARAVSDPGTFRRLWRAAIWRINLEKNWRLLAAAFGETLTARGKTGQSDHHVLAIGSGDIWCFPGRPASGKPRVVVASPYVPFPLSHGAAVRIYNLMCRAAGEFDQILICFVEHPCTPAPELLEICAEIVLVLRPGTHALPSTPRPDTVEEFDHPPFHAALRETVRKWQPGIAQLEFTQMAQYAGDCAPARTILVEHDITYDLYAQLRARDDSWELQREHERWVAFETEAWRRVDRVVTMSAKDKSVVPGSVCLPNGVDIERFQPSTGEPEPHRLLFIGSFQHRPNVLAVQWFLREVWPRLNGAALHVIAGMNHTRYWDFQHPGVEVDGFVADVRPPYRRASLVIAPLIASAGTNIKILEAMAMGKAIVSTSAGIHGLDVADSVLVCDDPESFAAGIAKLLDDPSARRELEIRARRTVEERYDWDAIACEQHRLYTEL